MSSSSKDARINNLEDRLKAKDVQQSDMARQIEQLQNMVTHVMNKNNQSDMAWEITQTEFKTEREEKENEDRVARYYAIQAQEEYVQARTTKEELATVTMQLDQLRLQSTTEVAVAAESKRRMFTLSNDEREVHERMMLMLSAQEGSEASRRSLFDEARIEFERLQHQAKDADTQRQQAEGYAITLRQQCQQYADDIQSLRTTLQQYTEETRKYAGETQRETVILQQSLQLAQSRETILTQELNESRSQSIPPDNREVEGYRRQIRDLEAKVDLTAKAKLALGDNADTKVTELTQQVVKLQVTVNNLEGELSKARSDVAEADITKTAQQEAINEFGSRLQGLQQQVDKKERSCIKIL